MSGIVGIEAICHIKLWLKHSGYLTTKHPDIKYSLAGTVLDVHVYGISLSFRQRCNIFARIDASRSCVYWEESR